MLSLADNGLGLISWTAKAAEKMGVELWNLYVCSVSGPINDHIHEGPVTPTLY